MVQTLRVGALGPSLGKPWRSALPRQQTLHSGRPHWGSHFPFWVAQPNPISIPEPWTSSFWKRGMRMADFLEMAETVTREWRSPPWIWRSDFPLFLHGKGLQDATFYSPTGPQEIRRPSLWGTSPIESGEEFLHYSEKVIPWDWQVPSRPRTQLLASKLFLRPTSTFPCLQIKCGWRHTLTYIIYIYSLKWGMPCHCSLGKETTTTY